MYAYANIRNLFPIFQKLRKVPGYIEVRWFLMYQLTDVVVQRFQGIILTLAECGKRDDNHGTVCAGLYSKMFNYPFLVEVVVLNKIMGLLQALSELLQASRVQWHQAASDIRTTLVTVKKLATDTEFINLVKKTAHEISEQCGLPVGPSVSSFPVYQTRLTSRSHLQNAVNDETLASDSEGQEEYEKLTISQATEKICKVVADFFDERYPDQTLSLLKGLDSLDPVSPYYMEWATMKVLVERYGDLLHISKTEVEMETLKYKHTKSSGFHPPSFPNIMKLCHFRDTIAPTSAECERGFSTMNRIKTPIRSCLADERTSDLVVLGHEKDLTKGLNLCSVLDVFAKERRRIKL